MVPSNCKQGTLPSREQCKKSEPTVMELWQRLGHASFGDWRRASEKARRTAKKAAAAERTGTATGRWHSLHPVALPSQTLAPDGSDPPLGVTDGSIVEPFSAPSLQPSSLVVAASVHGELHETVHVTPRGRRMHKFEHSSPGGTVHVDEYVSPAGVQLYACQERLVCLRRLVAAQTAARRAKLVANVSGCGSCEACLEFIASFDAMDHARYKSISGKRKPMSQMEPFEIKRVRVNHRACDSLQSTS